MSPNLLERFSGESLSLILNMTPATANANAELFLKHVAPASYASIASKVRRGASELIRNYASSVFYPMTSAVDAEAKSVCINGERRLMIANTVTESHEITACMRYLITAEPKKPIWLRNSPPLSGKRQAQTRSPNRTTSTKTPLLRTPDANPQLNHEGNVGNDDPGAFAASKNDNGLYTT